MPIPMPTGDRRKFANPLLMVPHPLQTVAPPLHPLLASLPGMSALRGPVQPQQHVMPVGGDDDDSDDDEEDAAHSAPPPVKGAAETPLLDQGVNYLKNTFPETTQAVTRQVGNLGAEGLTQHASDWLQHPDHQWAPWALGGLAVGGGLGLASGLASRKKDRWKAMGDALSGGLLGAAAGGIGRQFAYPMLRSGVYGKEPEPAAATEAPTPTTTVGGATAQAPTIVTPGMGGPPPTEPPTLTQQATHTLNQIPGLGKTPAQRAAESLANADAAVNTGAGMLSNGGTDALAKSRGSLNDAITKDTVSTPQTAATVRSLGQEHARALAEAQQKLQAGGFSKAEPLGVGAMLGGPGAAVQSAVQNAANTQVPPPEVANDLAGASDQLNTGANAAVAGGGGALARMAVRRATDRIGSNWDTDQQLRDVLKKHVQGKAPAALNPAQLTAITSNPGLMERIGVEAGVPREDVVKFIQGGFNQSDPAAARLQAAIESKGMAGPAQLEQQVARARAAQLAAHGTPAEAGAATAAQTAEQRLAALHSRGMAAAEMPSARSSAVRIADPFAERSLMRPGTLAKRVGWGARTPLGGLADAGVIGGMTAAPELARRYMQKWREQQAQQGGQ